MGDRELTSFGDVATNVLHAIEPDTVLSYTIAVGTAFGQITLNGIFEEATDAMDYAEAEFREEHWQVVPIWQT